MDYCTSGPTHHTTEDIAMLRVLPNLTILSPASVRDVEQMVRAAAEIPGPVYIRLGRERGREVMSDDYSFQMGKAVCLHQGDDATIISTGTISYEALEAAKEAEKMNLQVRVLHMGTIKPLDNEAIIKAAKETKNIITIEEHSIIGGLGGATAEILAEQGLGVAFKRMGLNDTFALGYGNHDEIKKQNNLNIENILDEILRMKKKK
jgi:transketolase